MGYVSRTGRRPYESASKSSHTNIIKDNDVKDFLNKCTLPKTSGEVEIESNDLIDIACPSNPIKFIIAIDGGYSEVYVRNEFPSAKIAFFQFGALIFSISDLEELSVKPFIEPEDISKLKEMQRFKITIPTKNITLKYESTLINSVRKTIYDFFMRDVDGDTFAETLKWFIYEEYDKNSDTWNLANCPICGKSNVSLERIKFNSDNTYPCPKCNGTIYLTDVFRLHEAIDNEIGAGGILGYLTTLLEQMVLIHLIRIILRTRAALFGEVLFIKDGPLAFFGQTANMYKPMRKLVTFLLNKHNLYMAGLEKSGAFVEHADEISNKLSPNKALLISNEYIYKYIIPGTADPSNPYGRTTYYGNKVIYKSNDEKIYVVSLPTEKVLVSPKRDDIKNIDIILKNVEKLRCDMYDNALVPIALVNNLVSLANHPSSVILEKFAKKSIKA